MSDSVQPHRRQPTRLPSPWDSPGKNTGVGCHFLLQCMKVKSESEVAQSSPTLSNPMDCSLPGSSIHGIFQAEVMEWGAIAFSVMKTMNPQRNSVSLKQKKCEENYAKARQNQTLKIKEGEILTGPCHTACGILLVSFSTRDQTPAP